MKTTKHLQALNEIQGLTQQIRSINESIAFGDEDDYGFGYENEPDEEGEGESRLSQMKGEEYDNMPMDKKSAEEQGMQNLDQAGELDQIREICLKGMIKFCKNPEDPTYQALKKIFQMVDKGVEKKEDEQQVQRPMR